MVLRERIRFVLNDTDTLPGKLLDLILLVFNLLACVLFVVASYAPSPTPQHLVVLEIMVVIIFIIEYLARIRVAEKPWHYVFSFYGLIDLISIVPTFLPIRGMGFLRGLKVLRILRFLRYLEDERFFFGRISRLQLQGFKTIFIILTILFVSAGLILYSESGAPRGSIKGFGEAFYFCVVTMATVGFGDFVPVTTAGRWFTVVMILMGLIIVPWQAGKLVKELLRSERLRKQVTCPQCGLTEHERDASHCKACGAVIFQEYEGDD